MAASYQMLADNFDQNPHGMVEQVKAFIECVCITIIGEFKQQMPAGRPTTTELLATALNPLGLQTGRGASNLGTILSGFNKIATGLEGMRNENGPVAHGRDAFLDAVTQDHARAFVHVGDAILGVLLDSLEGRQPDLTVTRQPYESFPHLNDRIDGAVSVEARVEEGSDGSMIVVMISTAGAEEAVPLRVEPSRLLYGIDRSAYVEMLRTADVADKELVDQRASIEPLAVDAPQPPLAAPVGPLTQLVSDYRGTLDPYRGELEGFLASEGLASWPASTIGLRLIDSLLATADGAMGLDWKDRSQLRSGLKVASKRVFVKLGVGPDVAELASERLLSWWLAYGPDTSIDSGRSR